MEWNLEGRIELWRNGRIVGYIEQSSSGLFTWVDCVEPMCETATEGYDSLLEAMQDLKDWIEKFH